MCGEYPELGVFPPLCLVLNLIQESKGTHSPIFGAIMDPMVLIQVDAWTKEGGLPNCRALCFVFGKISPFVPPAPHGVRGGSIRATAYLLAPVPPASSTSPPVADWGGCSDILGSFEDRGVSRSHEHTCPHPIGHFFPFWIELWTIRKGMVGMRLMHDYLVFGDYFFIHSGWRWQKGESYNAIFGIPSHFYPQSALFAARGGTLSHENTNLV